jgi:hypothetical protein
VSAFTSPVALIAALAGYLRDGEPLTLPHGLAKALAESIPAAEPRRADQGSAPGGDFTARDLMARYRRSAAWTRERFAAGDFGPGYRMGRERVARREDVEAYDQRQRAGDVRGAEEIQLQPRARRRVTSAGPSLIERRKAG